MRIYLKDQSKKLGYYLDYFKTLGVADYNKAALVPKSSSAELELDWCNREKAKSILFDYSIFPLNILVGFGEWTAENRKMRVGDTIVQQAYLPPNRIISQKIVFGVRDSSHSSHSSHLSH
ncbi:MAG TPA: hypothetical protein VK166_10870 [Chitinophagaceae bacterium]|nr:hypothetical protein [Chitinophagaceae bacterium]